MSEKSDDNPENDLYIGELTEDMTEDDIKAVFAQFGEVQSLYIPIDRLTRKKRAYGFVKFGDSASVDKACACSEILVNDQRVKYNKVFNKKDRPRDGQRYGNRRDGDRGDRPFQRRGGWNNGGRQDSRGGSRGRGGYQQRGYHGYSDPSAAGGYSYGAGGWGGYGQRGWSQGEQAPDMQAYGGYWNGANAASYGTGYAQSYGGGASAGYGGYRQEHRSRTAPYYGGAATGRERGGYDGAAREPYSRGQSHSQYY